MRFFIGNVLALQLLLSVLVHCAFAQGSMSKKRAYDVPDGAAEETLRIAAEQGHIELVFASEVIVGYETSALKGRFLIQDALDRMLEGTPLVAVPVSGGKAFGVIKRAKKGGNVPKRSKNKQLQNIETKTQMNLEQSKPKQTIGGLFKGLLALAVASSPNLSAQDDSSSDEEVYELSPFTIQADDNTGYLATSTLAGTRLKSDLRDIASSISVVTKEFLEDTGSTNLNELLVYTSNTEAFGASGNFSNDQGGQASDTAQDRAEPQRSTRVRGLDPADLTRNYYLTDIAADSYNTDRVSINRGANNILFGLGSPSGIINQTTGQASLGRNFGTFRTRFDDEGSVRASLNYNKVLVEDKLAIRIAALNDDREYKQKPAMDRDERYFVALTAKLWEGMTVRANLEKGNGKANRPNPVAPPEAVSAWFRTQEYAGPNVERVIWDSWSNQVGGDGSRAQWIPGQISLPLDINAISTQVPALPRIQTDIGRLEDGNIYQTRGAFAFWSDPNQQNPDFGSQNRINQNSQARDDPRTPEFDSAEPGFLSGFGLYDNSEKRAEMGVVRNIGRPQRRVAERNLGDLDALGLVLGEDLGLRFIEQGFTDTTVFDFTNNLISGGTSFQDTDFDTHNITLEQLFLEGKLGFEAGFDQQNYSVDFFAPFRSDRSQQVFIDINTALPTGIPNPNFGRPFVSAQPLTKTTRTTDRESSRFTAFYNFDLEDALSDTMGEFWSQFFGNHTITAFYNEQTIQELTYDQGLKWGDTAFNRALNDGKRADRLLLNNSATDVQAIVYIGDPVIDAPNFESVRIGRIGDDVRIWNPGSSVPNMRFWDPGVDPNDPTFPAQNNRGLPLLDDDGNVQDFEEAIILADGQVVQRDVQMVAATLNALRKQDDIESTALIMQSKFFSGNLVGTLGYRDDTSDNFTNDSAVVLADGTDSLDGFSAIDGRFASVTDETFSWSVVGHLPKSWAKLPFDSELSFHLGESENFQAEAGSVDRFLNPIAPPNGRTREAGITLSMFQRKLYARMNWYETSVSNSVADSWVDNGISSTIGKAVQWLDQATALEDYANDSSFDANPDGRQDMLDTVDIARKSSTLLWDNQDILPDEVKANFGNPSASSGSDGFLRSIDGDALETPAGMSDTQDLTAEGVEFEIVYNPTPNWTILANISQQEAIRANVAPRSEAFYDSFFPQSSTAIPGWAGLSLAGMPVSFFEGAGDAIRIYDPELGTFIGRPDLGAENEGTGNFWFENQRSVGNYPQFLTLKSSEGAPQPELREWRVNIVTNYQVSEGRFKGLGLGGAIRWQDEASVGFPTIRIEPEGGGDTINIGDVQNPYFDGTESNIDLWASYHVPLMKEKVDWKIQLNVQNVFANEDDVIVTAVNPNGEAARVRFAPQRSIFLTNSFSF
ncbi:MAG: hypothetical protein ACI92G_000024 [Candidatus Pelagisphaera sp.]|jgi:hypothetical protein